MAVRHEGAHVAWGEVAQHGEGDAAAEMLGQEIQELADVAFIGLDRFRRHPPLGTEMGKPVDHFAGRLGRGAGRLSLVPCNATLRALVHGSPAILSSRRHIGYLTRW